MISVELNVVGGKHSGQVIPLDRKKFLIGREQDCHLRPNSELVSRHHCVFTVDDFSVRVRDLGSTNGTLVNGERIRKEVVLQPGDHVLVGSLEFDVNIKESQQDDAVTQAPVAEETIVAGTETLAEMPATAPTPAPAPTPNETGPPNAGVTPPVEFTAPEVQPPGVGDTTVIAQPVMMPGQTPYQPMMPQMGYPMYGNYPYPGMPQQMPMYPQQYPGQPMQTMPGQTMPGQPVPAQPDPPAADGEKFADVSLPNPAETGAKEEPPKPAAASDGAAGKEEPSNSTAAAIIQKHMQRRPGG